jgi:hypothetical protein
MSKAIHRYRFKSSSGGGTYETLLYSDGTTSCDCPGWTRRCVDGVRTCKHVRAIEAGTADDECDSHAAVGGKVDVVTKDGALDHKTTKPDPTEIPTGGRKFL